MDKLAVLVASIMFHLHKMQIAGTDGQAIGKRDGNGKETRSQHAGQDSNGDAHRVNRSGGLFLLLKEKGFGV